MDQNNHLAPWIKAPIQAWITAFSHTQGRSIATPSSFRKTVLVSLDSVTKCPKELPQATDVCLPILVKVREVAAQMGSGESLFSTGRKCGSDARCVSQALVFARVVSGWRRCSGKLRSLREVEPGWRKWATDGSP